MRWRGKVAFMDLALPPRATLVLELCAVVGGPGLYDLRRCLRVVVAGADGAGAAAKVFTDASLVEVVET